MKTYWIQFGSGDPSAYTGLSPSLSIFSAQGLTAITGPAISEAPVGSGFYKFQYGPTLPIVFVADGGSVLAAADRYVTGTLDPVQAVDEKIGDFAIDSFGSTSADPSTIAGYLKRNQEFNEGDAAFTKSTGIWSIYSRGSSTLLREKALTNTLTSATKS